MVGMGRKLLILGAVTLAIIAGAEGVQRLRAPARTDSLPYYHADNRIGYIPLPNQSGIYRGGRWVLNELSMGTDRPFAPTAGRDILLVGDSIVFGINLRQSDKLGAQLEQATGARVWPIGVPSWAFQNELQYLRDHPQVVAGADQIVFVLNGADFDRPTSWKADETHPLPPRLPRFLLWEAIVRHVRSLTGIRPDPAPVQVSADMRVAPRDNAADLAALVAGAGKPVLLVFYPNRAQAEAGDPCGFPLPSVARVAGVATLCIKQDARWSPGLYADYIHPSRQGSDALAQIIAAALDGPGATPVAQPTVR